MGNLHIWIAFTAALFLISVSAKKSDDVTELQIGVKYKPESCDIQAHKGDTIKVHYRGALTDGTIFDSSYESGNPFAFKLGHGQVIKGWDQGLLGMCVGEKRKLKIPPKLGYGDQGSPPAIPGGATLIFDTELVAVNGRTLNAESREDPHESTGDHHIDSMEDDGDDIDTEEDDGDDIDSMEEDSEL